MFFKYLFSYKSRTGFYSLRGFIHYSVVNGNCPILLLIFVLDFIGAIMLIFADKKSEDPQLYDRSYEP